MNKREKALWDLIDKMEQQLSQFQDKMDIGQIWNIFLDDIQSLIRIEISALFLEKEETHEFLLHEAFPPEKEGLCRKEQALQIECGMFASIIRRRRPGLVPSLAYTGNKELMLLILPFSTVKRTRGVAFLFTPIEESSLTNPRETPRTRQYATMRRSRISSKFIMFLTGGSRKSKRHVMPESRTESGR